MKKLMKIAAFFLSLSIYSNIFAELPKTLHFATEATYPPFEFVDATGKIQGFDVDVVNALCKQMNVICTVNNQPFDSLIPSLKLGKFDALIGGLNITAERQKQVDFTDAYYASTASFISLSNKITDTSVSTLKGKTVGIQAGTTLQDFLKTAYPDTKIKTYASQQDAFLDLISGRVDLVFADTPMALSWLKSNNNKNQYAVVGDPVSNKQYFGNGYGIAVKKDNTELLSALNKALVKIKADDEYQKIVSRYFSG